MGRIILGAMARYVRQSNGALNVEKEAEPGEISLLSPLGGGERKRERETNLSWSRELRLDGKKPIYRLSIAVKQHRFLILFAFFFLLTA